MKLYSLLTALAIFACLAGVTSAQTPESAPTDDTQIWNDLQVTVPLKKKVDLNFTATFRWGRNLSSPVSQRGAISIAYKANKFLTFETGYLYVASQPSEGRKSYNTTFSINGTLRFPVGKFRLSNRNQFERRFRNSRSDSTRYRNRMRVEYPVTAGNAKFNVFASNEVFYDWSVKEWVRNRLSVGANKKLNERLTGEIYYMRQNDGRSRPGDLHVIGTLLKIQL